MKKLLLSLVALFALGTATVNAQMAAGNIAPDFTGTDINGNTWNLYSLLDQGKTVYIDVSATWCGPCWNYHNGHALEDLYAANGPTGTTSQDVMVFFVEGDASTTLADLQGTGGNTQGDWVTGTPYPIIDDATIGDALQISYFPTIYIICPDRIIKEVGQLTATALYNQRNSNCSFATSTDDAGITNSFTALNGTLATCDVVDLDYRLCNYGTSPLTSATIDLTVNGTVQQSYNWTGSLNTYNSEVLTFSGVTGTPGTTNAITFTVSNPNGNTDGNSANNSRNASFITYPLVGGPAVNEAYAATAFPPSGWYLLNGGSSPTWTRSTAGLNGAGSAKMDFYNSPSGDQDILQLPAMDLSGLSDAVLTFDLAHARYGSSNDNLKIKISTNCGTTWTTLYNKTGAALSTTAASTASFTPSNAAQWRNEIVSLSNYIGNDNVFIKFEANSNYGNNAYVDNVNVSFNTAVGTVTKTISFEVYPNPASSVASVDFTLDSKDDVTVEVFSKVGTLVYSNTAASLNAGDHSFSIPVEGFAKGLYMVNIRTSAGSVMKKLVVE
ncbi:MAG TPA: T9SS type A sorting domain-containing protein [Bacteroidia bacterium]|nr:T9SS type A sorting domain-containing protein [Bacteroidia bacterium]